MKKTTTCRNGVLSQSGASIFANLASRERKKIKKKCPCFNQTEFSNFVLFVIMTVTATILVALTFNFEQMSSELFEFPYMHSPYEG